jgi:hypothetical protein
MLMKPAIAAFMWAVMSLAADDQSSESKVIGYSDDPGKELSSDRLTLRAYGRIVADDDGAALIVIDICNHAPKDVFVGMDISNYEIRRKDAQLFASIMSGREGANRYMFLPSSKTYDKLNPPPHHWSGQASLKLTKANSLSLNRLIDEQPQGIVLKTSIRWFDSVEKLWNETVVVIPLRRDAR